MSTKVDNPEELTDAAPPEAPSVVERKGEPERKSGSIPSGTSVIGYLGVLLVGIYLGILFTKSEVARWDRIHAMFLFREAHLYLIITTAIVVAGVCMLVINKLGIQTVEGQRIEYSPKPYHKGVIIGGALFGAGWAITGSCPGPIYAQIGGGEWMAWITLAGALLGMFCYAVMKPKLPH